MPPPVLTQTPTSGQFIPTSNIWDVGEIQNIPESEQLKELLVRLYQNLNNISLAVNNKDTGIYNTQEFLNGQLWFPNPNAVPGTAQAQQFRPDYRKVFRLVLPAGLLVTTTILHEINITDSTVFTRIYGTAQNSISQFYFPLPYVDSAGNNIELTVSGGSIVIDPVAPYPDIREIEVVLEYLQT